jgi:hypothetical protein
MKILLYNPDNGVTRNFMPHLWMFLLKSLTPPGHEVLLIDGNAQPMDELQIAQYVRDENIGLVGIGAMTRMIAKARDRRVMLRGRGLCSRVAACCSCPLSTPKPASAQTTGAGSCAKTLPPTAITRTGAKRHFGAMHCHFCATGIGGAMAIRSSDTDTPKNWRSHCSICNF